MLRPHGRDRALPLVHEVHQMLAQLVPKAQLLLDLRGNGDALARAIPPDKYLGVRAFTHRSHGGSIASHLGEQHPMVVAQTPVFRRLGI